MNMTRRWLPVMAMVAGVLAVVALLAALAPQAQAQDEPEEETVTTTATAQRSISVQGEARVSAAPDQATVRLGVVTQAPTATAALDDNSALMQAVISATLALEIDEEQVRTETVQLFPVYSSSVQPPGQTTTETEPAIVAYRATNVVAVTLDDVALVGDVLDAATTAGANTVEGISFEIADRSELLANARRQAMRDARERAETYLEETDAALGAVLRIREQTTNLPFGSGPEITIARDVGVPVLPGQQFVEVAVEVTWAIE